MNFAANGLDLKQGDEVLISSLEHPGGIHPWKLKEKRFGIVVKEVPLGVPPKSVDEIVDAFKKAITPKTKVISISHTVYITGLIASEFTDRPLTYRVVQEILLEKSVKNVEAGNTV